MTNKLCIFCGKSGPVVCESEACQRYDREYEIELKQEHSRRYRDGLRAVLAQRGKDDLDSYLLRFLYCLKFFICLCFGWHSCKANKSYQSICLAEFNYARLYAGWECEIAEVGSGWDNWWCSVYHDGEWNL